MSCGTHFGLNGHVSGPDCTAPCDHNSAAAFSLCSPSTGPSFCGGDQRCSSCLQVPRKAGGMGQLALQCYLPEGRCHAACPAWTVPMICVASATIIVAPQCAAHVLLSYKASTSFLHASSVLASRHHVTFCVSGMLCRSQPRQTCWPLRLAALHRSARAWPSCRHHPAPWCMRSRWRCSLERRPLSARGRR